MIAIVPFALPRCVSCIVLASALVFGLSNAAAAQESFKTPEAAVEAFGTAAKSDDSRKALLTVLGQGGADIVSSGDPVADDATRQRFLDSYDAKHQVTMDGDDKATLIIGQDDFPFPIPLVRKDDMWRFDTAAGRREILYRRVGRNELDAIQAALAYVDAQNDYADKDRTGAGQGVYAQRIVSEPGKKNGLYWPATQDGDESPLGELVAQATAQGYRVGGERERAPYHGYYFKVLTKQGRDAPGGALDYVVHGKMIGGFALVAYPAQYGNSGIMTFLVNHNGIVYQKDLGPRTAEIAGQMSAYNPDQSWTKVETPEPTQ
jgi:Protein of unknown function (DUF2950)